MRNDKTQWIIVGNNFQPLPNLAGQKSLLDLENIIIGEWGYTWTEVTMSALLEIKGYAIGNRAGVIETNRIKMKSSMHQWVELTSKWSSKSTRQTSTKCDQTDSSRQCINSDQIAQYNSTQWGERT